MPFDPITWGLGFGASQATKKLLEHLFNSDIRTQLSKVADEWSESLPQGISTPAEVVFGINDTGPARERLQLRLILHNQVPDETLWFNALYEAWIIRKEELKEQGNGFLQQSETDASKHLKELASALTLTCKKQSELFQVSALTHLEAIASKTDDIDRNVGITMSAVLNHLDNIAFRPQLINQRAITQLLENPHHCHGQGLMELNSLLLIDEPSTVISGRIRKTLSWVGAPNTTIEKARFVPPKPNVLPKLVADFVGKWSSDKSQFHSRDQDEVIAAMASFHYELVSLHPFEDGNGRVARVLTDYQAAHLLYHNEPFKLKTDDRYFSSLESADHGDITSFVSILKEKTEV
jgi:hypothetical protein